MRVLADTHVLLWWLADDPNLSPEHRRVLADRRNDVHFSAVSVAEVAIKASLGKLEAPEGMAEVLVEGRFAPVDLTAEHAERLRHLPWHHRDPFDRMIVAQAQVEGMTVATVDPAFRDYDVPTV
ncbi:type II toxin-antitoxin system VapC family toxin [Isoptericola sp. BMS4]|uniref:type II toxin-antitoxin system VapC family toxin n=1 Tax=Isoptericola sp. BMS4 TaxID=2527875 RepID=UPI0014222401|nr:type II toxin-antitoxin system VapC family toxin [Isoptericola sp. BMS4]